MASVLLQVRIDSELKAQAAELYDKLGLDLPTAVRMFLTRSIAEQGLPFDMRLEIKPKCCQEVAVETQEVENQNPENP